MLLVPVLGATCGSFPNVCFWVGDIVGGVFNFLGSVLLQQKFEVMDGPVL